MSRFNTSPRYLYTCACHEAGHAVGLFLAARRFGISASDVVIGMRLDRAGDGFLINFFGQRQDECRALINYDLTWFNAMKIGDSLPIDEKIRIAERLEFHIIVLLAGPYADAAQQYGFDGCLDIDLMSSRGDLCEVKKTEDRISSLSLPYSIFQRKSWMTTQIDARDLVRQNWRAIEAIASKLMDDGELSGVQAFDLFDTVSLKQAA